MQTTLRRRHVTKSFPANMINIMCIVNMLSFYNTTNILE